MKNQKRFRGVFTSDLLPKNIKVFENGIINLDISTVKGMHWFCYYNDPKYKYIGYFDQFGEYICNEMKLKDYIPENIKTFLDKSNKKTHTELKDSFIPTKTYNYEMWIILYEIHN